MSTKRNQNLLQKINRNNNDDFIQMILLDEQGRIVESCDTLFDTRQFKNISAVVWSPFVESMFDYLMVLPSGTPEILFSRVEKPLEELAGFYDFTFLPIEINQVKYLLWTIYDYTTTYSKLQHNQQLMNNLEIERQNTNSKIHRIVNKNLSFYRNKNITQNSLLQQVNQMMLQEAFTKEKVFLGKQEQPIPTNTFSLFELLNELEYSLNAIQKYSVKIITDVQKTLQLKGNKSQLLYIIYELLGISNVDADEASVLQITARSTDNSPFLSLDISIHNTRLQPLPIHNQELKVEFSQMLSPTHALRIGTIINLIHNQIGAFEWKDFTPKGAFFQIKLPFRAI